MGRLEEVSTTFPTRTPVLLPEPVNGCYMMLHRPCVGNQDTLSISLAISESPTGDWQDLGPVMRPIRDSRYCASWVGAGSCPIPLENNRFLVDYHTGNYYATGERDYFASYAVLDFDLFDVRRPEAIVESRCECVLAPETAFELNSPWPHEKPLNCVFPCGSYEHNSDIVLVYGGADAYVLAARLNRSELLSHLETMGCNCRPNAVSALRQMRDCCVRSKWEETHTARFRLTGASRPSASLRSLAGNRPFWSIIGMFGSRIAIENPYLPVAVTILREWTCIII